MKVHEYRKHIGVSKSRYVYDWIEKGYLPNVLDPETGEIDIPADMPRPYRGNGKTNRISKLTEEIQRAADLQCSLYPQMFPKIREDTFSRTIDSMLECRIIARRYSSTGAVFYELLPCWKNGSETERKTALEVIGNALQTAHTAAQIVQIAAAAVPLIHLAVTGLSA